MIKTLFFLWVLIFHFRATGRPGSELLYLVVHHEEIKSIDSLDNMEEKRLANVINQTISRLERILKHRLTFSWSKLSSKLRDIAFDIFPAMHSLEPIILLARLKEAIRLIEQESHLENVTKNPSWTEQLVNEVVKEALLEVIVPGEEPIRNAIEVCTEDIIAKYTLLLFQAAIVEPEIKTIEHLIEEYPSFNAELAPKPDKATAELNCLMEFDHLTTCAIALFGHQCKSFVEKHVVLLTDYHFASPGRKVERFSSGGGAPTAGYKRREAIYTKRASYQKKTRERKKSSKSAAGNKGGDATADNALRASLSSVEDEKHNTFINTLSAGALEQQQQWDTSLEDITFF
jgi:hypothetical protein